MTFTLLLYSSKLDKIKQIQWEIDIKFYFKILMRMDLSI